MRQDKSQASLFPQFLLSLTPMKFLGFIFAVYLLTLSCLPCGDMNECNDKAAQTISATTDHQQHKHSKEACTPFCSCSCCAASGFYVSFSKTQSPKLFQQSEKYPSHNISFLSQEFSSIWQPPKIG